MAIERFWVPFYALGATQGKQGSRLKLKAFGLRQKK
jgi:hypothetical protein